MPLPWLSWFALAPLFVACQSMNRGRTAISFFLFGGLWWSWSIHWLIPSIMAFTGSSLFVAITLWLSLSFIQALPYALIGYFWHAAQCFHSPRLNQLAAAALFAVSVDLLTPLIPGTVAHSQYLYPLVIQLADIAGPALMAFFVVFINLQWPALIKPNWQGQQRQQAITNLALSILIIVGYGYFRLHQFDDSKADQSLTVGYIQPNLQRSSDTHRLAELSGALYQQHPTIELLVWPEFPAAFSWQENIADRAMVTRLMTTVKTPLLLNSGYVYAPRNDDGKRGYYNSNQLIGRDGKLLANYHKQILVPFFEYLPFEQQLKPLRRWFPQALDYRPGPENSSVILNDNFSLATPICYEILFDYFFQKNDFDSIINQSNDGWFAHDSRGSVSHLALGLFRSVEYRRPWLRVSNSGISVATKASGKIIPSSQLATGVQDSAVVTLHSHHATSPYSGIGRYLTAFMALVLIAALTIARWRQQADQ
ncbi:Apolipoprotein N-acyltransferase [Sinobacterium norvegicum]|uniref:Apolipoprotein N-acyltransferase n=2 Tax=Sinobacterium norvegicum TaxID=1641715 RepID=A0ABM9AFE9_9GAMM|nr:Apolipoprotein N-acyltransferase [Sinobacterium norvegicum]